MFEAEGVRAVSFDGDDTLWDFDRCMRYALGMTLEELRRTDRRAADALDVEKMIEIRNRVAMETGAENRNLFEVRFEAFRCALEVAGRPDDKLARHLNALYIRTRLQNVELYDDVLPTLKALGDRYILGVVSNGNTLPDRVGLEGFFDFILFAEDIGVAKPDPQVFHKALERAGCSREEFLHVGDSVRDDVVGARKAGVRAVWLNRTGKQAPEELEDAIEIASLRELTEML